MTRAIAAVVAVVALVAAAIWLVRPGGDGGDPKEWEAKAEAAFRPLVEDVPDLVRGAREWQAGERPAEVYADQVQKALADFTGTQTRVLALKPSPKARQAGELYEDSAELYVQVGRIYQVMLSSPPGDLRTQLDLLARRVRELADRVYDRGHAALAPYLDEQQQKDVEVRLPEEVPIWTAEGLAAGPPLDDTPSPAAASPPLREATRPQQSPTAWARAVRRAGIPSDRELAVAIDVIDGNRLRDLARRFVAAAERLRDAPDPKGERDRSAILRLGLLVDGDAARAAQAASLLPERPVSRLGDIGRALARVGDGLVGGARP
jgi:hypothetical protein